MSTTSPGQVTNSLLQNYGFDSVYPSVYLTGAVLTAAATSFPTLSFPAYNSLRVIVFTPSVGGSDMPALRFNGDSGANYNSRSVTVAVGATLNTNTETASDTLIRLGVASANGRIAVVDIGNTLAANKPVVAYVAVLGANPATVSVIHAPVAGGWFNTAAQITSLSCLTQAGQTMGIGSSIQIFGGL